MSISNATIRPAVLQARQYLAAERNKLREQHNSGSPGIQVCTRFTDILDNVVMQLFEDALQEVFGNDLLIREQVAIVPHSG
ncbi:MAG: hypothetical protein KDA87_19435, partial [Planctomycetales bacterium]|nr:hypothetical protein [Planctomycetales bacterium]